MNLNPNFGHGDKIALKTFQFWYHQYKNKHDMLPIDLINLFTMEEYSQATTDFSASNMNILNTPSTPNIGIGFPTTPMTGNTRGTHPTVMTGGSENPQAKANLKDYPKFNGSLEKWRDFKHLFRAAANAHGYGRVLNPDYIVPGEYDPDYEQYDMANRFMFATLVTSVIHGTANATVLNFDDEQDGRSAWFALCDWYESQGSTENMIKRLTDDINTYKLTAGTHFGAEGYISKFQRNLYELKQP